VFPAHFVLVLALLQATPSANSDYSVIRQDIPTGKYQEAREKIQQSIKKSPQDIGLWRQLGEVDVRLQDTDGAIAALQKVRSLAPRDAGVYFNLGVLFVQKGAPAEALKMYSQGLALDPHNEEANRNYAFLLMQSGKASKPSGRSRGSRA